MRSMPVAELLELPQRAEQVVTVPDEGAVQEFVVAGLHPPFRDRVRARYSLAAEDYLDARVGEDGVEQYGHLPVPVPEHEPCPAVDVFEVHAVPPRPGSPRPRWG
jgi:hypothetical protein